MASNNKNIFILGTARDGPKGEPVLVRSMDEARQIFGGMMVEEDYISAGTDHTWIAYPAKPGTVQAYRTTDNRLKPSVMFNLAVDPDNPNRLTFDDPGGTMQVVWSYERQYAEGEVLRYYEEAIPTLGNVDVYLVRISGIEGTIDLDDAAATPSTLITLTARNPGYVYNLLRTTVSSNTLTFTFPEGLCASNTRSYDLTGKTCGQIASEINAHTAIGMNAVRASAEATTAATGIVDGTTWMAGGDDQMSLDVGNYGDSRDSLTESLITVLELIEGMEGDVIASPLPHFLKRKDFYSSGISIMAYDWDCLCFGGQGATFYVEATPYSIPATSTGDFSVRAPTSDGFYEITAPTTISTGQLTQQFSHWIIYGSAVGLTDFQTNRAVFWTNSNPVQVLQEADEAQVIAVYRVAVGLTWYRGFYTVPGAQTSHTAGQAATWIAANGSSVTDDYNLNTIGASVQQLLQREKEVGYMPSLIFPTLRKSYHTETKDNHLSKVTSWVSDLRTAVSGYERHCSVVVSEPVFHEGLTWEHTDNAYALYASLATRSIDGESITGGELPVTSLSWEVDYDDLSTLETSGIVSLVDRRNRVKVILDRTISTAPTDPSRHLGYMRAVQRLVGKIRESFTPMIGGPFPKASTILTTISDAVSQCTGFKDVQWDIEVSERRRTLNIDLSAHVVGFIHAINVNVNLAV
jgi:hypothetical protein